ncbi:radical SAM protein [Elusimicrobiota bacterium]
MIKSISEDLFERSVKNHIPLTVNFEITGKCNQQCLHCYHDQDKPVTADELSSDRIGRLLVSLKDSGTMFLTITGGEPFIRDDIEEVLDTIYDLGFSVIVFTNGTLIDKKIVQLIKKPGVFAVHVSVYSMDSKVHDGITRVEGSLEKTLCSLQMLKSEGVNTVIKCPVMKENMSHAYKVKEWADDLGIMVKIDPFITPCENGKIFEVLKHRIPVADIAGMLLDGRLFNLEDFRKRERLECPAAKNTCAIDAYGNVFPCIAWRNSAGNITVVSEII